ncbi:MAG: polysaccharide biosynthesis C-terminal domain-containing protein [Defluviitaleaceae bacterium]|nr:polysaccharide biosynthesis C-terminal domain-containing protein [Defluviitaleaceae bacterium]
MNGVKGSSENNNARDVAAISLGGRFLTFLGRTMYIGWFGTANQLLNAFTFALRVPNVIFTVLGAALGTVMIPIYSSLLAEKKEAEAKRFIDNVITISIILLGLLVAVGLAGAPLLARVVAGADFENPEYLIFVLRVLIPAVMFFGFGAIFQGILHSHGIFRLPAFVTAPGGIILILYLILFGNRFGVTGLVFAAALGIFMQPFIMLPAVHKLGYRYRFSLNLRDKNVRAAGRLCVPVLISVASYQFHFIFGQSVALRFNTTAVMDYSQEIVQVFILTIVYAIAAVYLPKLSVQWAKADMGGFNESLRSAMGYTFFLVLPAAVGFFILRFEIMEFLLGWQGQESYESIQLAGNMMGLYAVAVVVISFKEVADRAFYSGKDSKTPAIFGVVIMVINILVTILLISRIGVYAMPVAYGVAAVIGCSGLVLRLHLRTGFIDFRFLRELFKVVVAVLLMAVVAFYARGLRLTGVLIVDMVVTAMSGAAVYFAVAWALKVSAVFAVFKGRAK